MVAPVFSFARTPELLFGAGLREAIPGLATRYGRNILLVTGRSFIDTAHGQELLAALAEIGIAVRCLKIHGEPSPDLIATVVRGQRQAGITAVLAIGGGSVLDAGKAIAAMLTVESSILDHLEGLPGFRPHPGTTLPVIAVPTTAGTGSEATKNAVLSHVGEQGFKRSLRHDNFVPAVAVIDPELALSCPPAVTAACGLDALTQLLEGLVSTGASPLSDALALSGIVRCAAYLLPAATDAADSNDARAGMAYAAYLSGLVLANAGLGIIHGLAGPLGARFPVPHGVACGVLLPVATEITIAALRARDPQSPALAKYAQAGGILAGGKPPDADLLVSELHRYAGILTLPRLSTFGMTEEHIPALVRQAGQKTHPVQLTGEEIAGILRLAL